MSNEDGWPVLSDDVTEDAFLGGRLKVLQPLDGPRAGIDAVFLAAACRARPESGETVLDAGAASGVVGLCVAGRIPGVSITGIEIDAVLASAFRENVKRNGYEARIRVIEADLTLPSKQLEHAGLRPGSFDHVLANPPYFTAGDIRQPRSPRLKRAHVGDTGALAAWLKFLHGMAAPKGSMTIIHQASALPQLLSLIEGRFGGAAVFPLFPRAAMPAIRVIVQAVKGSRAPLKLMPGLVLHETGGAFTAEAQAILRSGSALLSG